MSISFNGKALPDIGRELKKKMVYSTEKVTNRFAGLHREHDGGQTAPREETDIRQLTSDIQTWLNAVQQENMPYEELFHKAKPLVQDLREQLEHLDMSTPLPPFEADRIREQCFQLRELLTAPEAGVFTGVQNKSVPVSTRKMSPAVAANHLRYPAPPYRLVLDRLAWLAAREQRPAALKKGLDILDDAIAARAVKILPPPSLSSEQLRWLLVTRARDRCVSYEAQNTQYQKLFIEAAPALQIYIGAERLQEDTSAELEQLEKLFDSRIFGEQKIWTPEPESRADVPQYWAQNTEKQRQDFRQVRNMLAASKKFPYPRIVEQVAGWLMTGRQESLPDVLRRCGVDVWFYDEFPADNALSTERRDDPRYYKRYPGAFPYPALFYGGICLARGQDQNLSTSE